MRSPQATAIALVATIPGCHADRFQTEGNTVLSGRVIGRGPSLQRTGLAWAAMPASFEEADVEAALAPYVALQMERWNAAVALGLGDTLATQGGIEHIVVDRCLRLHDADVIGGNGRTGEIARQSTRLNQYSRPGLDGIMTFGSVTFADPGLLPGDDVNAAHDLNPRALARSGTDWGGYDGARLFIARTIPETLVIQLPGRRVRDVLDPAMIEDALQPIADRTILDAEQSGGRLVLTTRPDWTPLVSRD